MKLLKQNRLLAALLFIGILMLVPNGSMASSIDNVNPASGPSYLDGQTTANLSDLSTGNPSLYTPEPSKKTVTRLESIPEKASTPQTSQAPEPTTLLLLGIAIVGLVSLRKRTQKYLSSSNN